MTVTFRSIDTGVRPGRKQIAFDEALVELHRDGVVPDTIRFLRFPPTVLIGRHQAMGHEVKVEHCRQNGIGLARRITGGGAIYLDEGQVGWELVLSRARLPMSDLGAYTVAICEAVAHGLSQTFDIAAQFRPRSDIEVEGRKICGTGGFFDGDTLIYQGTVLVDVEPVKMLACLNVPDVKPAEREFDPAEQRVTTLKAVLGETPSVERVHGAVLSGLQDKLGIVIEPGEITAREEELAAEHGRDFIETDDFVFEIDDPTGADVLCGDHRGPGGALSAYVRLEGSGAARRVREVLLTGNFFVAPPRAIFDLEAALRGILLPDVADKIDAHFAEAEIGLATIQAADVKAAVAAALARDRAPG